MGLFDYPACKPSIPVSLALSIDDRRWFLDRRLALVTLCRRHAFWPQHGIEPLLRALLLTFLILSVLSRKNEEHPHRLGDRRRIHRIPGALGHAAADGDFTLREAMQFLHLSSIAIWCGGILVAGLATLPMLASREEENEVEQFGRRLSLTVTFAFAIVVLSGLYNSWKGLGGSLRLLSHSAWGCMLLLKLSFVLIALGHGTRVRFLLKARDGWSHNHTTIMQRWVRAEALFMLLILISSGWLANMPPAGM